MPDDLLDDYIADGTLAYSSEEESDLEASNDDDSPSTSTGPRTAEAKKRKRRELEKAKKVKKRRKMEESAAQGVPHTAFASQSPAVLAKYVATIQAKAFDTASAIELDDLRLPETCIEDTSNFLEERSLENLTSFIDTALPQLKTRFGQKSKDNGAPTLLFFTAAALRGADVIRELKKLRTDKSGQVAKLFAKHFKVEEHISYLRRTKVVAAVGTPGRIGKLLEAEGCLRLEALSHIIIDFTYQDSKKRNLFDIPETRQDLFKAVLANERLKPLLQSGKVKLVLF